MATYRERTWFFENLPDMPAKQQVVAMRLFEMADEARRQGNQLIIRNEILAQECGTSIRTVQRCTAALVLAGVLDKIARYVKQSAGVMRRIANRYRVAFTAERRAWRVLYTVREKLYSVSHDSLDAVKTRVANSDRFLPSETYKRLMNEGLDRWRG